MLWMSAFYYVVASASAEVRGSTNWNISANVLSNVQYWLMACRPGTAPIGPCWPDHNWFGESSNRTINNATRCPLHDNQMHAERRRGGEAPWPAEAQRIMANAGPRRAELERSPRVL